MRLRSARTNGEAISKGGPRTSGRTVNHHDRHDGQIDVPNVSGVLGCDDQLSIRGLFALRASVLGSLGSRLPRSALEHPPHGRGPEMEAGSGIFTNALGPSSSIRFSHEATVAAVTSMGRAVRSSDQRRAAFSSNIAMRSGRINQAGYAPFDVTDDCHKHRPRSRLVGAQGNAAYDAVGVPVLSVPLPRLVSRSLAGLRVDSGVRAPCKVGHSRCLGKVGLPILLQVVSQRDAHALCFPARASHALASGHPASIHASISAARQRMAPPNRIG